jgi:hypothetical protein
MHDEELEDYKDELEGSDDDIDLDEVDVDALDDDILLDDELDDEELPEEPEAGEEETSETSSLDQLLAQRAAARRGTDEADDEDDIMALASERDVPVAEPVARVLPLKERQEFVCARCHLVKARSQLADANRGLCRDCV